MSVIENRRTISLKTYLQNKGTTVESKLRLGNLFCKKKTLPHSTSRAEFKEGSSPLKYQDLLFKFD